MYSAIHQKIDSLSQLAESEFAEGQDSDFAVVNAPAGWRTDARKPLLVIIHPGDAIERQCDWSNAEAGREVAAFSMKNQFGMAAEIAERLRTHDVLVLHRLSSPYLRQDGVDPLYRQALDDCDMDGVVLFGDDLVAAGEWIVENVPGARDESFEVFMTGAYADEQYGCITEVGKLLLKANPKLNISVSEHSPTDNSNSATRWNPRAGAANEAIERDRTSQSSHA